MFRCILKSWITLITFSSVSTISDGSSLPLYQSNACYLTGVCGLHTMECPPNHRIAISSASYGFKPYSDACFLDGPGVDCWSLNTTYCCAEQPDQDCVLSYREQHLQKIFEKCSGYQTCKTSPISVKDACYSMSRSEPASFSKLKYGCIKDSATADFCHREMVIGPSVSAVFKPNGLNMLYDKNCYCRIESATSAVIDVQVYAFDIRFPRSTSDTCSELSISKGRETHGTVSTPNHPGDGFIHSFLPLINLTTPILTRLLLSKHALPDHVWLHFESVTGDLRVKCGRDSNRARPSCMDDIHPTVPSPKDFTPHPVTLPERPTTVVGIMIGALRILFAEKTPVIGGSIAAVMTVFSFLVIGFLIYKRKHLKKMKTIQPLPKDYNSQQPVARKSVTRFGSPKLGLGRARNGSRQMMEEDTSDTSSASVSKEETRTVAQKLVSEVQSLQPNIPNDANIIIVSRPSPSRNASVRSSCTCSSRHGQGNIARPPDVVLDSRAALQSACNDLGAVVVNTCCGHERFPSRNMNNYSQVDFCNHGNSGCHHNHHHFCGHEIQLRPNRLNSFASQVSIGTQIYGDPLPEVPEVPVLQTRKNKAGRVSRFIEQNNPLYIVHNPKKVKENVPNPNRIWNWLKKCKPTTRKLFESPNDERPKKVSKREESSIEELVINTSVTSPSVLPLPAPPLTTRRELPAPPSRSSSIPSTAPPKPPPRFPTRPPRHSLRNAIKTMNDVYTQVMNPPPRQVKPRVPRRRAQDNSTQVYHEPPTEVAPDDIKTPAIIDVTAQPESEASVYANDYIIPVHGSSVRRDETTARYDEVSIDNEFGDINFLHTVTLGIPPEEEETVSRFDRLKSVLWQSVMRFRRK